MAVQFLFPTGFSVWKRNKNKKEADWLPFLL